MKTKNMMIACALAIVAGCAGLFGFGDRVATTGLKVNHLAAPANVADRPVFSWKMEGGRAAARQTAYRIEVREDAPDGTVVWDSGPVGSGCSVGVQYEGKPLKSARRRLPRPQQRRMLSSCTGMPTKVSGFSRSSSAAYSP